MTFQHSLTQEREDAKTGRGVRWRGIQKQKGGVFKVGFVKILKQTPEESCNLYDQNVDITIDTYNLFKLFYLFLLLFLALVNFCTSQLRTFIITLYYCVGLHV